MWFGAIDVSVRVIGLVVAKEQLRQAQMIPNQLLVPIERGRDVKGCFETVDGPLHLALGAIYAAKEAVTLGDPKLFPFV